MIAQPPSLLIVLCGPNGAGKSSFYEMMLKSLGLPFINADMIAKKAFGEDASAKALTAAKMADARRLELIQDATSFIMETVLSDSGGHKLRFFRKAQAAGFALEVYFIGLNSVELSAARVQGRVDAGGHDVPLDRINARYPRILENLRELCSIADRLTIFDNSSVDEPYRLIACLEHGQLLKLCEAPPSWTKPIQLETLLTPVTKRL